MPVETRHMELVLATIVDGNKALFNDSALAHVEHSLGGSEFALVGVSTHMNTADLEWLILQAGGSLTKHITENTDYVIKGSQVGDTMHPHTTQVEDLQMYKVAAEKGITILNTLEFFKLLGKHNPQLSINNLVDGWNEHITFSLRDASSYGLSDRHVHKYSLEIAKSNRSRCHGHCKNIIPKGEIRLKACFDPLSDSFVYFRCLKCITPVILKHIEKEWKEKTSSKGEDSLLQFALAQPDVVLSMFQTHATEPAPPSDNAIDITESTRLQWAQNLVNFLIRGCAEEVQRREEEHIRPKTTEKEIPIVHEEQPLGKRKRDEAFSSAEMMDFMHSIPSNMVQKSVDKYHHSKKVSITTEQQVPLVM